MTSIFVLLFNQCLGFKHTGIMYAPFTSMYTSFRDNWCMAQTLFLDIHILDILRAHHNHNQGTCARGFAAQAKIHDKQISHVAHRDFLFSLCLANTRRTVPGPKSTGFPNNPGHPLSQSLLKPGSNAVTNTHTPVLIRAKSDANTQRPSPCSCWTIIRPGLLKRTRKHSNKALQNVVDSCATHSLLDIVVCNLPRQDKTSQDEAGNLQRPCTNMHSAADACRSDAMFF